MKLVYIANARIPSEKAHPYQIVQMCEAFAEQDIVVELWYARRRNPHPAASDFWSHYGIQAVFAAQTLPCADLFPLANRLPSALRQIGNRLAALLQLLTFNLSVIGRLRRLPTDTLIYSRDPITLWLISWLRPKLARESFFEAHTYPETQTGARIRGVLSKKIAGTIVITEALAERYASLGFPQERILTEHDGVNLTRFDGLHDQDTCRKQLGWRQDAFIIGYLGRLVGGLQDMDKGLDTLIAAVDSLRQQHSDVDIRLALVGGPESFIPKLLAKHPDLSAYLIAPGQVTPGDVPQYLAAFDVCTIPSPWNDFFAYYTSPLKLFEYMAVKRPIVASALPSTEEILTHEENALLIPPSDVDALQSALEKLLTKPELAQVLAQQAFQDVEHYTWNNRAARIVAWARTQIN